MKIILDCYGGTGAWSKPYEDAGYTVFNIDICRHESFDVRLLTSKKCWVNNIYGMLFAPPCTNLAGSGARWWKQKGEKALLESLSMIDVCFRLVWLYEPKFWALENPVGRLVHYLGKPKLIFNPYDYGDPYKKKTCLWGNFNIPKKNPVEPIKVCPQGSWVQKLGGGCSKTKKIRSITPQGFAKAFYEANK